VAITDDISALTVVLNHARKDVAKSLFM